ncbi:hypothetical protein [Paraburkholderia sp. ZP32-5]|uniref:hypothetical protein n=1 Tax=Paraburkholderia sp. ZP32-5 TaxID=2883245 RepID=UPI001F1769B0|nr:hypothetical protein [Paraburkholderia sp. ZP32-5]
MHEDFEAVVLDRVDAFLDDEACRRRLARHTALYKAPVLRVESDRGGGLDNQRTMLRGRGFRSHQAKRFCYSKDWATVAAIAPSLMLGTDALDAPDTSALCVLIALLAGSLNHHQA